MDKAIIFMSGHMMELIVKLFKEIIETLIHVPFIIPIRDL